MPKSYVSSRTANKTNQLLYKANKVAVKIPHTAKKAPTGPKMKAIKKPFISY